MRGGAGLLCWALSVLSCCVRLRGEELVFHVPDVVVAHEPAPGRAVGTGPAAAAGVTGHYRVDGKHVAARREQLARPAQHDDHGQHSGVHYEEFFVEHEISALEARTAADELRLQNIPPHAPGCGVCSREEIAYCEWQVVADHCCCERRFQEPYPWIPHTCYAGPQPCRPIARDCGFYRRLRDCCCDRRLAEKWKSILSSSPWHAPGPLVLLAAFVLPLVLGVTL